MGKKSEAKYKKRFISINDILIRDPRRTRRYTRLKDRLIKQIGKCQDCGSEIDLEAHHIKGVANFPELAYVEDNIKILCHKCHKSYHKKICLNNRIKHLLENKDKITDWSKINLTEEEKHILGL